MDFDPKLGLPKVPSKGGKPMDHTALFARALKLAKSRKPVKGSPVINLQLEFNQDGKPLTGGYLYWSKADGCSPLAAIGTRMVGRSGRAVASFDLDQVKGQDFVSLKLKQDGETIDFPPIRIETSRVRSYKAAQGIKLKVAGPESRLPSLKQAKKGKRRFDVALAGSFEQLENCLPEFQSVKCFRVRMVFMTPTRRKKRRPSLPKVKTYSLDKGMVRRLNGIDVLFDLSNNPIVRRLAKLQKSAKPETKTIIAPDCSHLADQAGALIARLNQNSAFAQNLKRHGLE